MGVEIIVKELDRLYQLDIDKYLSECEMWKKHGFRIFRNSEGRHKVVSNAPKNSGMNDIFDAYGGIFGDIFGKGND